jgi:hypothetical protein
LPLILLGLGFCLMLKIDVVGKIMNEFSDLLLNIGKCLEFDLMKEIKCSLWRH